MRTFVAAICFSILSCILLCQVSIAGDAERQRVFQCYYQGASTVAQFRQCTGLTGDVNDFRGCLSSNSCFGGAPGGAIPAVQLGLQCAEQANGDITQFARCTGGDVILPRRDQVLIRCAEDNVDGTVLNFATCAAPTAGIKLLDDQRAAIGCARRSHGDQDDFLDCLGGAVIGNHLNSTQRDALECASQFDGDASSVADCAAEKIFNANATPEVKIAARCAAQSDGDIENFGVCVGTAYMSLRLNPEQQIAVECVVGTGGQLYATAGCIATRLTGRELEKCVTNGFGGNGCFGNTNDLFGYNGWTARTLKTLTGGPNSVFNNPAQIWGGPNSMFNNPQQIWGGPNSMFNNPAQIWGGPNLIFRNPSQVFGGPNSMFNNPGQILGRPNSVFNIPAQLAPPPVSVGSVGSHRVCVPWCSSSSDVPSDVKALQPVYFATNRKVVNESKLEAASFIAERSMQLKYGITVVSVPKNHVIGNVERPKFNYFSWSYNKETNENDFRISFISLLTRDRIVDELRTNSDNVLLLIHGYNVSFQDAIFKAAQVAYDANFDGSVLVFSWPSAGQLFRYDYDRESAQFSGSDLLGVLRILTEEIGKKRIYVVAHSLGNQVLVDALQQAALSKVNLNISELVMAAPDVDRDVFMKKAEEIKSVAKNITMYASSADKALLASDKKAWGTRMGYIDSHGPNLSEGVETIDVTAVGDDMFGLNHSTFSGSRAVLDDLGHLIRSRIHLAPVDRTPTLQFMPDKEHVKYWLYPR